MIILVEHDKVTKEGMEVMGVRMCRGQMGRDNQNETEARLHCKKTAHVNILVVEIVPPSG